MAKRKTPIPENETYILPSSNEEMEKFIEKFRIDMTEHIVSSIEFAIDNKSPIIEVFQFKNSDYVITIAEKDYDLNLTHIHDLYNKFKLYELCPRIEKIKDKLKKYE